MMLVFESSLIFFFRGPGKTSSSRSVLTNTLEIMEDPLLLPLLTCFILLLGNRP